MRTKWLASAALAALVVSACSIENINNNNNRFPPSGTVVGSVTDTSGSCIVRYDLIASGPRTITVGGEVTLTVFPVPNESGCPTENNFQGEASRGTSVVRVANVNPMTLRVTGVAVGTDNVCAVSIPGRRVSVCADITVTGTTSSTFTVTPVGPISLFPPSCPASGPSTAQLSANSTANWTLSNAGVVTLSSTSGTQTTVTAVAPGTITVTAAGQGGSQPIVVTVNQCPPPSSPQVVWTLSEVCFSTLAGSPTTVQIGLMATGVTNPTVTLTSSNNSFVGVANATQTGNSLTWTLNRVNPIVANGTLSLQYNGVTIATLPWRIIATACPGTTSGITVDVQPATFSLIVGQTTQQNLTCTVSNVPAGQSTGCDWEAFFVGTTTSAASCILLTETGPNTVRAQAIMGCGTPGNLSQIEVRGKAEANPSIYDTSIGTTSSGDVTCTITWNGTTTGNITVAANGTTTVTVVCQNQFGATFSPYWHAAKGTSVVSISGTNGQTLTIGGVTFPSGTQATIRGTAAGTDVITAQAAITDVRAVGTRTVIVQ